MTDAWHALWDALRQAVGLPCTRTMLRRQERQIARDWELYYAGLQAGRTTWRCERNGLTPDGNVRERLVAVVNETPPEQANDREAELVKALQVADVNYASILAENTRLTAELAEAQARLDACPKCGTRSVQPDRETRLARRIVEYEEAYAICENHAPDVWEGDGTCVICEGQKLSDQLSALRAELVRANDNCDSLTTEWKQAESRESVLRARVETIVRWQRGRCD